jgi:hypothetical protein
MKRKKGIKTKASSGDARFNQEDFNANAIQFMNRVSAKNRLYFKN